MGRYAELLIKLKVKLNIFTLFFDFTWKREKLSQLWENDVIKNGTNKVINI